MNPTSLETNTCPSLATVPTHSLGQRIARLERYLNVRFRNKLAPMVRSLARHIPANAVVFDVGANHGEFAKQVAQLHAGTCRVFAFEPLEYNYTLLETVTRSFRNVKVIRAALSNRQGQADLFLPIKNASKRIGHAYGIWAARWARNFLRARLRKTGKFFAPSFKRRRWTASWNANS